ncbi:hypothetical protein LTR17_027856, partial [Elasticomyces elasticus]
MDDTMTVIEAWTYLNTLARRVVAIEPKYKYTMGDSDLRMQQLLSSLPQGYEGIKLAIDTQNLKSHERILELLMEMEASITGTDTAMFAGRPRFQKSLSQPNGFACLLCDQTDHRMKDCPGYSEARKAAIRKTGPSTRVHKRSSPPPSKSRRKSSPRGSADLIDLVKKLTSEVAALKKGEQVKKHRAFLAQSREAAALASPASDGPSDGEDFDTAAAADEAK